MHLGAITADWINQNLYQDVLGRTGDAEGVAYWTQEAAKQGWTEQQLANVWMDSAKTVLQQSSAEMRAELAPAIFDEPAPVIAQPAPIVTQPVQTMAPMPQQMTMQTPLVQNLLPVASSTTSSTTSATATAADDSGKKALLIGALVGVGIWIMRRKQAN